MAPLLFGARRSGCSPRAFEADVREPGPTLLDGELVTYPIFMPREDTGTARFVTPSAPFAGGPRFGARVDGIRWYGDSWSQALIFPAQGSGLGIMERGWTLPEERGFMDLGISGRLFAVRSVEMGGCSSAAPYIDGSGGGIAEMLDAGVLEGLRQALAGQAVEACAQTCLLQFPEPISYLVCLASCSARSAEVGRNKTSSFWPVFGADAANDDVPDTTETVGESMRDDLCFEADYYARLAHCETNSVRITACFSIHAETRFVPLLERDALRSSDRARAPEYLQSSDVSVVLRRLDASTGGYGVCATVTDDTLRDTLRDPVGGLAASLERAFEEELWSVATCPLPLTTAERRARCRLDMGTNDVRTGEDGQRQFRVQPDAFEVFPNRLEIVLNHDYWEEGDEPAPSVRVDRQVRPFRAARLCDDDRSLPVSVDYATTRLVIP